MIVMTHNASIKNVNKLLIKLTRRLPMTDNQKQYVVNTLCKMTESDAEIAAAISIKAKEAISALGYEEGYSIRVNAFSIGNTVHINITDMAISKTAVEKILDDIDATVHVDYDEDSVNEAIRSKEPYAQQLFDKISGYKAGTGEAIAEICGSELILSNCGKGFYDLSIQGETIQNHRTGKMFAPHAIARALVFFEADRTLF